MAHYFIPKKIFDMFKRRFPSIEIAFAAFIVVFVDYTLEIVHKIYIVVDEEMECEQLMTPNQKDLRDVLDSIIEARKKPIVHHTYSV